MVAGQTARPVGLTFLDRVHQITQIPVVFL
jgi:hypothetical protein